MIGDTDRPTPGPVRSSTTSTSGDRPPAVALLMTPATYRSAAFLGAAERLGLAVVRVLDLPDPLTEYWHVELGVDFTRLDHATDALTDLLRDRPVDAILALDDSGTLLAAQVSAALHLPHNDPASALAARDKLVMREALAAAGVPSRFHPLPRLTDPTTIADTIAYPVVVKPLRLSGSRGVIRADTQPSSSPPGPARTGCSSPTAIHRPISTSSSRSISPASKSPSKGLLTGGELQVLALFDKPDPLDGPFFEETIYVTPSRLPAETQALIARRTAEAAAALGLREGPVHAELRINERDAWPIELAGRSIGGLCSSVLEFGAGISLEELILRHAVGLTFPPRAPRRSRRRDDDPHPQSRPPHRRPRPVATPSPSPASPAWRSPPSSTTPSSPPRRRQPTSASSSPAAQSPLTSKALSARPTPACASRSGQQLPSLSRVD